MTITVATPADFQTANLFDNSSPANLLTGADVSGAYWQSVEEPAGSGKFVLQKYGTVTPTSQTDQDVSIATNVVDIDAIQLSLAAKVDQPIYDALVATNATDAELSAVNTALQTQIAAKPGLAIASILPVGNVWPKTVTWSDGSTTSLDTASAGVAADYVMGSADYEVGKSQSAKVIQDRVNLSKDFVNIITDSMVAGNNYRFNQNGQPHLDVITFPDGDYDNQTMEVFNERRLDDPKPTIAVGKFFLPTIGPDGFVIGALGSPQSEIVTFVWLADREAWSIPYLKSTVIKLDSDALNFPLASGRNYSIEAIASPAGYVLPEGLAGGVVSLFVLPTSTQKVYVYPYDTTQEIIDYEGANVTGGASTPLLLQSAGQHLFIPDFTTNIWYQIHVPITPPVVAILDTLTVTITEPSTGFNNGMQGLRFYDANDVEMTDFIVISDSGGVGGTIPAGALINNREIGANNASSRTIVLRSSSNEVRRGLKSYDRTAASAGITNIVATYIGHDPDVYSGTNMGGGTVAGIPITPEPFDFFTRAELVIDPTAEIEFIKPSTAAETNSVLSTDTFLWKATQTSGTIEQGKTYIIQPRADRAVGLADPVDETEVNATNYIITNPPSAKSSTVLYVADGGSYGYLGAFAYEQNQPAVYSGAKLAAGESATVSIAAGADLVNDDGSTTAVNSLTIEPKDHYTVTRVGSVVTVVKQTVEDVDDIPQHSQTAGYLAPDTDPGLTLTDGSTPMGKNGVVKNSLITSAANNSFRWPLPDGTARMFMVLGNPSNSKIGFGTDATDGQHHVDIDLATGAVTPSTFIATTDTTKFKIENYEILPGGDVYVELVSTGVGNHRIRMNELNGEILTVKAVWYVRMEAAPAPPPNIPDITTTVMGSNFQNTVLNTWVPINATSGGTGLNGFLTEGTYSFRIVVAYYENVSGSKTWQHRMNVGGDTAAGQAPGALSDRHTKWINSGTHIESVTIENSKLVVIPAGGLSWQVEGYKTGTAGLDWWIAGSYVVWTKHA